MGQVTVPLGLDNFVLKAESDLWFGRSSFLLKIHYQRKCEVILSLSFFLSFSLSLFLCFFLSFSVSLFLFFYCSKLEEEEKKTNIKEGEEKVEAQKVKREAIQVVVPGHQNQVALPFSLGQVPHPPSNPSDLSDCKLRKCVLDPRV